MNMIDQASKLREMVENHQKQMEVRTEKIRLLPKDADNRKGRIIAVTSGKGGVGKTNFVINLALTLARHNQRVAVVDLDLGLANVDILLNITPRYNIEDFLKGRKAISEILVEGPRGVKLLPGCSGVPQLADLDDAGRKNFIEGFMEFARDYDYILFDTAAGISKNVIEFVLIADEVVVVTTPEPTAITDAYAAIKVIGNRNRDMTISLLFNMVRSSSEAKSYYKRVSQVIHQFLKLNVTSLGYIYFDACVHQSIMKRKPFSVAYPFSDASRSLNAAAQKLMEAPRDSSGQGLFLVERLARLFRLGT